MLEFENLCKDSQVIYLLSLSELTVIRLSGMYKDVAEKTIEANWDWLINKEMEADDLYYFFENMDFTGLADYLMSKDLVAENLDVFECITDALAYILFIAYEDEGAGYRPQSMECVDEKTIEHFIHSFSEICNKPGLESELVEYLSTIEEFSICERRSKVKEYINEFI